MSRRNKHKYNPTQVGHADGADGAELVRRSLEILPADPDKTYNEFLDGKEPGDTGGLELNKFASPMAAMPAPDEIDWKPEVGQTTEVGSNTFVNAGPVGLTMLQALSLSPVHYMAARPLETLLDVVLVSNGRRFWTAHVGTLQPLMIQFVGSPNIDQPVWRPIVGDENGLRIS